MRRGNKRSMWPQAQGVAGLLAPEGALAQAVGEGYAVAQAADTRARQEALQLYQSYGAYGLASAAVAYGHTHGGNPAPVLRRLIAMLPARFQRAAASKVADVAADGSASPGVARCAVQYLSLYSTTAAQVSQHAAHLVAAERLRHQRLRAQAQRAAALGRDHHGQGMPWFGAAAAAAAAAVALVWHLPLLSLLHP